MNRNTPPRGHPDARRTDIADLLTGAARLVGEPGWERAVTVLLDRAARYARCLEADETNAEFRSIVAGFRHE